MSLHTLNKVSLLIASVLPAIILFLLGEPLNANFLKGVVPNESL